MESIGKLSFRYKLLSQAFWSWEDPRDPENWVITAKNKSSRSSPWKKKETSSTMLNHQPMLWPTVRAKHSNTIHTAWSPPAEPHQNKVGKKQLPFTAWSVGFDPSKNDKHFRINQIHEPGDRQRCAPEANKFRLQTNRYQCQRACKALACQGEAK